MQDRLRYEVNVFCCFWLSLSLALSQDIPTIIRSDLVFSEKKCGCGEELSVSMYTPTSQSSIWGRHWKHFDSTQEASPITMIKAMLTTILIAVLTAVSEAKWVAMLHAMREAILLAVHNAMRDAVSIAVRAVPESVKKLYIKKLNPSMPSFLACFV